MDGTSLALCCAAVMFALDQLAPVLDFEASTLVPVEAK
jgi:hypothetical protein